MNRRIVLGAIACAVFVTSAALAEEELSRPKTGPTVDEMTCVDEAVERFMEKWKLPGGAVAVSKDGRLVYARGFGWADVEKRQPVEPDSQFRIASISKPITGTMIMKLVEAGKLSPDDKVLSFFDGVKPLPEDATLDPRFEQITIRQCLQHTAGFHRGASFDPMFMPRPMMKLTTAPVEPMTIIRFMLGRELDFAPGEKYAYSNFGYCMLGRVIEQITGETYEEAVRRAVLDPIGARRTRIGKTRLEQRAEHEVHYYPTPRGKMTRSLFPDVKEKVLAPYGAFYLEAMDSHGAWISTTSDLLRLVASLEGARGPRLLKPESVRQMIEDSVRRGESGRVRYGYGWSVAPVGRKRESPTLEASSWSHNGALDGSATTLVRDHRGLAWTALFNARPRRKGFYGEMDRMLREAVDEVETWPEHDLFEPAAADVGRKTTSQFDLLQAQRYHGQ